MPRTNNIITSIINGGKTPENVTISSTSWSGDNGTISVAAAVPSSVKVGDTITDGNTNTYLITGISGNDLTCQDLDTTTDPAPSGSATIQEAYASLTAWNAGLTNTTLYSSGRSDNPTGEAYASGGDFTEHILINSSVVGNVILRAAAGESHDGTPNTGVRVVSAAVGNVIEVNTSNSYITTIRNLEIDRNGGNTPDPGLESSGNASSIFENNLLHGWNAARASITRAIDVAADGAAVCIVRNNIVYGLTNSGTGNTIGIRVRGANTATVYNNSVSGITNDHASSGDAYGMWMTDDSDHTYKNNVVQDVASTSGTAACFSIASPANAAADYNLSDDATASGGNSVTNSTLAFFDAATGDYHLAATDTDAIGAGVGPASDADVPTTDIDGDTRSGATCDIGADQQPTPAVVGPYRVAQGGLFWAGAGQESPYTSWAAKPIVYVHSGSAAGEILNTTPTAG